LEDFFNNLKVIAVVGASRHKEKWGFRVFVSLLKRFPNAKVYPINPKASEIAGHKAYPSLSALPEKPDLVVTVVPPKITEKVVDEAIKLGVKKIWMQPGSESDVAIRKAQEAGILVIHHACIVETTESMFT